MVNRIISTLASVVLGMGLLASVPAVADDDSSSDAPAGYLQKVEGATAVIIKVPVNARGEEMTSAAEMRLYTGAALQTGTNPSAAFEASESVDHLKTASEDDINRDSSTWGWCSYRNYGYGYGYNNYGYYNNYQPYYYNYGNYYNYGSPYSYNNYYNAYPYYGYRYYYYNPCY